VRTGGVADQRWPHSTEVAAYLLVAEAIDDAADRAATELVVTAFSEGTVLVVEASDNGAARSSTTGRAADRIGALGGSLHIGRTTLRAEIPCA
jgi:glucose-6-phosphate-specific signal transduction histidine kinase